MEVSKDTIENLARKIAKEETPLICKALVDELEKIFLNTIGDLKERMVSVEKGLAEIRETNTIIFRQMNQKLDNLSLNYKEIQDKIDKYAKKIGEQSGMLETMSSNYKGLEREFKELERKVEKIERELDERRGAKKAGEKSLSKWYFVVLIIASIAAIIFGLPKFLLLF